jgi:mannan endo-1,4-beta-mannosidase
MQGFTLIIPVLLLSLLAVGSTLAPKSSRAELLAYFSQISGKSTIAGQHNREPNSDPTKWTRVVHDITGVYPGLWGGDFLFLPDDVASRQSMVDEAIRQWNAGSVVALTWHVCPPTVGETCNWDDAGILGSLSNSQWTELMRDGSELQGAWLRRLDTIVPYLKQLQDAGVVPLWRPVHEINEAWSWWGGRGGSEGSAKLYRITHNHLVNTRGLGNMLWVWCIKDVEMDRIGEFWPGEDTVDIASLDMWMKQFPTDGDYQKMKVGRLPI